LPHFDSLWIADHFYGMDTHTDPFMEAWTTLTWLAAKFPDVMLCHHVLGQGYRNPALTAKMAATLQVLSGNRFILGIGAGWREEEYRAYGYEFPRPAVRFQELEELVHICRLMWTQEAPSFTGRHYSIQRAAAPPLPEVVPPVCIGAFGEQIGLPLAGRIADMWKRVQLKCRSPSSAHCQILALNHNSCSMSYLISPNWACSTSSWTLGTRKAPSQFCALWKK
jgi:alkanesulfonate monooxygenase SsuD/methylene tetrahydromethanopterin reductase-like flavin-dependent oxidoreductase (luciferase family)